MWKHTVQEGRGQLNTFDAPVHLQTMREGYTVRHFK
jgi:hypothetical protein